MHLCSRCENVETSDDYRMCEACRTFCRERARRYFAKHADAVRASARASMKKRYHTDPEYRAKQKAKGRAFFLKHREAINAQRREEYAKKRAEKLS